MKNPAFEKDRNPVKMKMEGIKGFLIDLDGVLYIGDQPIPGAQAAISNLMKSGYAFRFISNTTRKCRKTLYSRLSAMGFEIPEEYIFTPPPCSSGLYKENRQEKLFSSYHR